MSLGQFQMQVDFCLFVCFLTCYYCFVSHHFICILRIDLVERPEEGAQPWTPMTGTSTRELQPNGSRCFGFAASSTILTIWPVIQTKDSTLTLPNKYPARRGGQSINLVFPSMKSTLTPPKKTSVQGDFISWTEKSTSSQCLEVWMEQLSPDTDMVLNLGTHETHLATVATAGKSPGTQHSDPDTCDIFGPCKNSWNSDAQTLKIKHSK